MKKYNRIAYAFILPGIVLFCMFTVYPIIKSLFISFYSGRAGNIEFSGFSNYKRLFSDPIFWKSLKNTVYILLLYVPTMLFISVVIAVLLNNDRLKLTGVFRTAFYLPTVTSLVAYSILFSTLLQDTGLINTVLNSLGIPSIGWLSTTTWTKPAIIIAMIWRNVGLNMVIYLSALQSIPKEMYEAAAIDGASPIRQFFSITLPSLKPVIAFTSITTTIGVLQLFVEPYTLTNKGQPANSTMTFGLYIYQHAFSYFDFGYASAIAYVVVVIVVILSIIQLKYGGEGSE